MKNVASCNNLALEHGFIFKKTYLYEKLTYELTVGLASELQSNHLNGSEFGIFQNSQFAKRNYVLDNSTHIKIIVFLGSDGFKRYLYDMPW